MKIIAIITGNRKARIINMRTSNYDKYKIIFIDSCMYRVILSNTRRDARVIITKSFDPFLVSSLDRYIYSISERFRGNTRIRQLPLLFFPPSLSRVTSYREREKESILGTKRSGARRESGSRATSRQFFGQCLDEGSNSPRT